MFKLISVILTLGLLMGCSSQPTDAFPSSLSLGVSGGPYRLMAGDEVEVSFDQLKGSSGRYILGPQGIIHLPVLGSISIQGMTQVEAQDKLTEVFSKQYSTGTPHLKIISFQSSEFVTIIGEVNEPGNYPIEYQLSLIKAVGNARGFSRDADIDRIRVLRKNAGGEVVSVDFSQLVAKGDYTQDLLLFNHDLVYVPTKRLSSTMNRASTYLPVIQAVILTIVTLNQLR